MQGIDQTLDSREVAEMIEKEHSKLLRDIYRYEEQFAEANIGLGDFFRKSCYTDANNQNRPCYRITKKGCEFIAHKLTGQKGTEFTAKYINKFHEMESMVKSTLDIKSKRVSFLQEIKAADHVVKGMSQGQKISFYKSIYERHGLHFDIQPESVDCNKTKEYKNAPNCDGYRDEIAKIVRQIQDKGRLIRVYSFVKKSHEIENEKKVGK